MAQIRAREQQPSVDFCVLILAQLEDLRDKLAFASVCRASRAAAERDARCWQRLDVTRSASETGTRPPTPELSLCADLDLNFLSAKNSPFESGSWSLATFANDATAKGTGLCFIGKLLGLHVQGNL